MTDITDKPMEDFSYIAIWAKNSSLYSIVRCDNKTYERKIIADIDSLSAEENRRIANICVAALNNMTEPKPEKQEHKPGEITWVDSLTSFMKNPILEDSADKPISVEVIKKRFMAASDVEGNPLAALYRADVGYLLAVMTEKQNIMEDSATGNSADCAGTHNVESSAKTTMHQLVGEGYFPLDPGLAKEHARLMADLLDKDNMGEVDAQSGNSPSHSSAPGAKDDNLASPARLIAEIEALRQSAEGSQMVETAIATDAYNEAIDDVLKIIAPASSETDQPVSGAADEPKQLAVETVEEVAKMRKDKPSGMKDCKIIFKKCPLGHGRLQGANWIDNGCYWCEREQLKAENDRLRGEIESARLALTPSGKTKAILIGEFSFKRDLWIEGVEFPITITVPWTTTKEIMQAISKLAFDSQPATPLPSGEE